MHYDFTCNPIGIKFSKFFDTDEIKPFIVIEIIMFSSLISQNSINALKIKLNGKLARSSRMFQSKGLVKEKLLNNEKGYQKFEKRDRNYPLMGYVIKGAFFQKFFNKYLRNSKYDRFCVDNTLIKF